MFRTYFSYFIFNPKSKIEKKSLKIVLLTSLAKMTYFVVIEAYCVFGIFFCQHQCKPMLSSLYPQMMTYWGWRRRKGASESKDDRTSSQQLRRAYLSLLLLSCQFRLLYSESNLSEYLDSSTCISYMPYENGICCTQTKESEIDFLNAI